jgi:hypothetical protein
MAENAKLYEVQEYSGHKSLSSLGGYLHAKPERIEAALKKTLGG